MQGLFVAQIKITQKTVRNLINDRKNCAVKLPAIHNANKLSLILLTQALTNIYDYQASD
jgi:hypothetical protein